MNARPKLPHGEDKTPAGGERENHRTSDAWSRKLEEARVRRERLLKSRLGPDGATSDPVLPNDGFKGSGPSPESTERRSGSRGLVLPNGKVPPRGRSAPALSTGHEEPVLSNAITKPVHAVPEIEIEDIATPEPVPLVEPESVIVDTTSGRDAPQTPPRRRAWTRHAILFFSALAAIAAAASTVWDAGALPDQLEEIRIQSVQEPAQVEAQTFVAMPEAAVAETTPTGVPSFSAGSSFAMPASLRPDLPAPDVLPFRPGDGPQGIVSIAPEGPRLDAVMANAPIVESLPARADRGISFRDPVLARPDSMPDSVARTVRSSLIYPARPSVASVSPDRPAQPDPERFASLAPLSLPRVTATGLRASAPPGLGNVASEQVPEIETASATRSTGRALMLSGHRVVFIGPEAPRAVMAEMREMGVSATEHRANPFPTSETTVSYFQAADAKTAEALAERLGGSAMDMTGMDAGADGGLLEVRLDQD